MPAPEFTKTMKLSAFERSLAVVVGIDAYGGGMATLKTAVSDGKSVAELLHNELAFDEVWTKFDAEATLQSLLKLLEEELPNAIGANDRLLFYFAGHGIARTDEKGPQGFLIPQDAHPQKDSSWLPMHRFEQALSALKCRHCLLILDCCYGGAFRWSISTRHLGKVAQVIHKQRFDRFINDPAWQVITSAAYDQEAIDVLSLYKDQRGSNNGCSHSPFAEALLEGLGGKADLYVQGEEGDGIITASELCMYLRNQVEPRTQDCQHRQTPELWTLKSHDKGEFIFLTDKFNRDHLQEAPRIDENENPYRGLQSYDEANADLFFGREDCIKKLRRIVEGDEQRFTVVLGASGSGKSSLVKAGLIPALKKAEAGSWKCNVIRPGDTPADILGAALNDLQASQGRQQLLVVDQAEELVTLCRKQEQRVQFLKRLASTLRADKSFHLLFTLRSDFEPQVRDLALKPFWKQRSRYIVPMFSREELKRVIEEPASQKVVRFESDKLVDDLIDEVAGMPGGVPLLSFALAELYQRLARRFLNASQEDKMVDRIITQADFDAVGGVARSITKRADEIYEELIRKEEKMEGSMQRVLLRMVAESGEIARRRVLLSELKYPEPEDSSVKEIVDRFAMARLLTRGNDEQERPYVEPAHDALINGWTRLANWSRDQAPRLSLERQLNREVEFWQTEKEKAKSKKAGLMLWTEDPRLPQAADWAFAKPKHDGAKRWSWFWRWLIWTGPGLSTNLFNQNETDFIEASLKERFRRKRITWLTVAAVMGLLGGATQFSSHQLQVARKEQAQQHEAASRVYKNSDSFLSIVYGLAAAKSLLDGSDPGLAIQLSQTLHQAVKHNLAVAAPIPTGQLSVTSLIEIRSGELISGGGNGSLRRWSMDVKPLGDPIPTGQAGNVSSLIELANEELISGSNGSLYKMGSMRRWRKVGKGRGAAVKGGPIIQTEGGVLKVIELVNGQLISLQHRSLLRRWGKNGKPLGDPIPTGQEGVSSLIKLRNGELISGPGNGSFRRWDKDGKPLGDLFPTGQEGVSSLIELRNGELIGGGRNGSLRRWGKDGKPLGHTMPTGTEGSVYSLIEVRSGELIGGGRNGNLRRWGKDGKPLGDTIPTGEGNLDELIALSNGEFISGGRDGRLRRWNIPTPIPPAIPTGKGNVSSLIELRNGELIIGGRDGSLLRWKDGKPVGDGKPIPTRQRSVESLIELGNGELISGGSDGSLRRWRDGLPVGDGHPILTGQGAVRHLIKLHNGELISGGDTTFQRWSRRWYDSKLVRIGKPIPAVEPPGAMRSLLGLQNSELIIGGSNYKFQSWRDGKQLGNPIYSGQGSVRSLIEMSNGELITGGDDGSIRRWKNGRPLGDPIPTGQSMVLSLIELKNGELITGGQDGSLRRWKDGTPLGDPIPTGQGGVSSLIKLQNGDLLSGRGDGSLNIFSLNAMAKAACRAVDLEHDQSTLDSLAGRLALQTCKDIGSAYAISTPRKRPATPTSANSFIATVITIAGCSFLAIRLFQGREGSVLAGLHLNALRMHVRRLLH